MDYADQSASVLRFSLLRGAVDTMQFNVLSQETLTWRTHRLEVGIIGASHYLIFDCGEGCRLSEVFACTRVASGHELVSSGPLADVLSSVHSAFGHFSYSFSPRVVPWREGIKELHELSALVRKPKDARCGIGLRYEFPAVHADDCPPVTLVWAEANASRCLVRTAHCYPNEDQMVFTKTSLANGESECIA